MQIQVVHSVWIVGPGRHQNRLARLRQSRRVCDIAHRRAGIRDRPRIDRAGRTEISWNRQLARTFHPLPAQAQQNVRLAPEPAAPRTDDAAIRAASRHQGYGRADSVRACVTALGGDDMQGAARATDTALHKRAPMRALEEPCRVARFKARIHHAIRLPVGAGLDIIQQTLTRSFKEKLQTIRIARPAAHAEFHQRVALDQRPRRLLRFIAVRPVRGEAIVRVRIDQFQRTAAAVAPFAPASTVAIGHFVDRDVENIRGDDRAVRAQVDVRHPKRNALTAIAKLAIVVAHDLRCRQPRMPRQQVRPILCHHKITASRNRRARRNRVAHAINQAPEAQVHRGRAPIVQLDEFVRIVAGDRIVHDLADHDGAAQRRGVPITRRRRFQLHEARRSIRIAPTRNAIGLSTEPHHIQHTRPRRIHQEDLFTIRAEAETQLSFRPCRDAPHRQHSAVRDTELVRPKIIAQPATADVHWLRAFVEQLDEIRLRQISVCKELIDHHVAQRTRGVALATTRRATDVFARGPRLHAAFAITRPRQHERMSCSIRRRRPFAAAVVIDN